MKRVLLYLLFASLALVLTAAVALVLVARLALAPGPGEWPTRIKLGPIGFDVGVPTAIRLVTSPWFASWLNGHSLPTDAGTLRFSWDPTLGTMAVLCAPCSLEVPALGPAPLRLESLRTTVRRDAGSLGGTLEATPRPGDEPLRARWDGRLTQKTLQLDIDAAESPIARWFAVLAPTLPELPRARIGGTVGLRTQVMLPAGTFNLQPRIAQFTVQGLGTEAMLNARTSCGAPARLATDSWLARAVLAAEDQRFFTHPGYDIAELTAAIDTNQKAGQVERGGSTLTQQLARLLLTGGERSTERKLRELLYAVEMESTLGKARILQLYLDNAPWGSAGLCGAESAARIYFKRSARNLEPAQAVWLAAMLNNPADAVQKWQRDGRIDEARVKWVAENVRGIGKPQRDALMKGIANARFAPP